MRFEHGRLRTESCVALTALQLLLLLLRCVRSCERSSSPSSTTADRHCPLNQLADEPADARLRFCDAYELRLLLLPADCNRTAPDCDATAALDRFRRQDERAREAVSLFRRLLDRYDCENANSVSWTCEDCEEAYKQWVCAMYLPPLWVEGEGLKPCRYICRLVEQRCPYFHPSVKDQYAGERVFKCIDPDIPDLEDVQKASSYGPPNRCYCPQHLVAGPSKSDPECQLLTPSALQRRRPTSGAAGRGPDPVFLLMALAALLALRTR